MRDWEKEYKNRVEWIKNIAEHSGAKGFVFGNSGGKDSALTGILCAGTGLYTLGVIMPCNSGVNYTSDTDHALLLARQFGINTEKIDLGPVKKQFLKVLDGINGVQTTKSADMNINPRLRMTALYAVAQTNGFLVAGTSNKSEYTMGYFTKWGDGANDFNPIFDLCSDEILDFLRYLKAPEEIINKQPSAGLFEGQTDETEMGVTYKAVNEYIRTKKGDPKDIAVIEKAVKNSRHKKEPQNYKEEC